MKKIASRSGIALVQSLIAIALLATAAAVAAPAVMKARELSNRDKCRNNFKQIGQAAIKYAEAHDGELPGVGGGQDRPGIFVQLLPYLEHSKIAEDLAASGKPWHDPANASLIAKHLPVLQCPETPNPDRLLTGKIGDDEFKAAPTDYTGIPQLTGAIRDIFPPDHDRSSALSSANDRRTFTEITDGLSTSLMGIVEIADKPNRWQDGKLVSAGEMNRGQGTWVANGFNAPRGYSWDGTSFPGPCAMNCSSQAAVYSFHPEGCNFLFADGSVRFLQKKMDVWIFYAIVTRRGGEAVNESDY